MMLAVVSAQRSDGGTCSGDVGREMWGHEALTMYPFPTAATEAPG